MATRIIEYTDEFSGNGNPPCLPTVANAVQSPITASASSQQSAEFATGTKLVVVDSDEAVHVAFGSSPTATTSHLVVGAGLSQSFNVTSPGQRAAILAA